MCEEKEMFIALKDWLNVNEKIEYHTYNDHSDTQSATYKYTPKEKVYEFNINLSKDKHERLLSVAHGFAVILLKHLTHESKDRETEQEEECKIAELLYMFWKNSLKEKCEWQYEDFTYLLAGQKVSDEEEK